MRIVPPRDSDEDPVPPEERTVEPLLRVPADPSRGSAPLEGRPNETSAFARLVEDGPVRGDLPPALRDPDRDAWTQQVIGARIHWQYGPDGKRRPSFRHHTRRLDDSDSASGLSQESSSKPPPPPRES